MAIKYIDADDRTQDEDAVVKTVTAAITGASKANPCVITAVAHGFANGDTVALASLGGMVELNDRTFVVASSGADSFALTGEDSTGHTTYTSGGVATKLMAVTSDVRLMYDDTMPRVKLYNAVQRLKDALARLL